MKKIITFILLQFFIANILFIQNVSALAISSDSDFELLRKIFPKYSQEEQIPFSKLEGSMSDLIARVMLYHPREIENRPKVINKVLLSFLNKKEDENYKYRKKRFYFNHYVACLPN